MAIITAANFDYKGPLANFERDSYATLADMVSVNENYLPNVFIGVCEETGKAYLYNKSNTVDPTLGKWREIVGGTDITDYIRKSDDFSVLEPMYDGEIVQYIGETTENYTQGYFYKCISDGAEPATYSWEQIDVQPATDLIWGNIEGDITNQTDLNTELTSLQDQIDSLSGRGRYLTLWNSSTGLAETNPPESPYTYKTGDYFIVGTVAAPGETNYRPDGSTYVIGVASEVEEAEEVSIDDTYIFDGTTWHLQYNSQKTVTFTNIEGSPYDNTNLADALNSKVSKVEDASVVYGTDENGDQTTYDLSEFHKGGWHEVSTILDRDAIPDDLLEVGMIVYVTSEAKGYILTSLNTEVTPTLKTWEEYKPGQGDYIRKITTYPISSVSPLVDGEIIQYQGPTVPPYWNGYFYKDEQKYSYISSKSSNMGPASINIIDESLLRNYIYRNQHAISGGWSDIKLVFSGTYAATVYATNGETEVQLNGFNSQEEFEHIGLHVSSSAGYPVSGTIAYIAPAHVWTQVDVQPTTDLIWGNITGTLSDQTDLQDALNAKQDVLTPGNNITIEEDSQTGDLVISSTSQESFFRGRFEDWINVPTDSSLYQANFRGETTPCNSDYMVVDNASGYVNPDFAKDPDNIAIRKSLQDQPYGIDVTIGETTTHYYYTDFSDWTPLTESGWISIRYVAGAPGQYFVRTNITYYVDNERHNENTKTRVMVTNQSFETVHYVSKNPGVAPISLRGSWNFGYFGTWDEDGKNGWKPQYQVEDVLPIASPTEQGIAKLYNTTGQNTDGSMTQKSITDALDTKQNELTAGTNITIENNIISSTAQESFFRGNFNEWSDVPTDTSLYYEDIHGNRIPQNTDFIVIEDASQFIPVSELMHSLIVENLHATEHFTIRITDENGVSKKYYYGPYQSGFVAIDDYYSLRYNAGNPGYWYIKTNDGSPIVVKGTTYSSGQAQLCITSDPATPFPVGMPPSAGEYQGAWRFAYYGTWLTDGLTGWTPQYKIENTLPIATDTQLGVVKVDNSTIVVDAEGTISANAIESFFRGRFENWNNVPTDPTYYEQDLHNPPSKIPGANDYIVVNDMSDWRPADFDDSFELWNGSKTYTTIWGYKYDNVITTKSIVYNPDSSLKPKDQWFEYFGPHNEVLVRRIGGNVIVIAQTTLRYNGTIYAQGQTLFNERLEGDGCDTTHPHVIEFSNSTERKEGTWRMRYQGVWDTDGKNGWKPEYQIENVLPIATSTEPGITKLYTDLGSNTDGAVDQATVTTELGKKQDVLTAGNNITIDANNRIDAEDKTLVSFVIWEDEE